MYVLQQGFGAGRDARSVTPCIGKLYRGCDKSSIGGRPWRVYDGSAEAVH